MFPRNNSVPTVQLWVSPAKVYIIFAVWFCEHKTPLQTHYTHLGKQPLIGILRKPIGNQDDASRKLKPRDGKVCWESTLNPLEVCFRNLQSFFLAGPKSREWGSLNLY